VSRVDHERLPGWSCGLPPGFGTTPALLAFAADAGAFAALGGQDVGVAGVGVAPAQAGLVPLEYSIERLTCAIATRLDAVMVGWPDAAQDRIPADLCVPRMSSTALPSRFALRTVRP
jgi:hypothetical protein